MILPRLRGDLNVMPSPDQQNPGIHVSDMFRFSDAWLIIPSLLVQVLKYFDGIHTRHDVENELTRLTGQADTSAIAQQLIDGLDVSGFLVNETYLRMRDARHRQFAESPVRQAVHAGSGYPVDANALRDVLNGYLAESASTPVAQMLGIAAPHVSPFGGAQSYGAAYSTLTPDLKDRTFVILGTSHYGAANRFGLTRKPFETPFGLARTNTELVDELSEQTAVVMEDYCHAIEHTIEFQVVFLQHLYGSNVKILPILCGSFGPSIMSGGNPEDDEVVAAFFGALKHIAARETERLFWIMGVDMAHVGARYGDGFTAVAEQGEMLRVKSRDFARIASLNAGDRQTFWQKISENHDDLKWCGASPLYTFMNIMPHARGTLQRYDQWNIDERSIVSFAGITFSAAPAAA